MLCTCSADLTLNGSKNIILGTYGQELLVYRCMKRAVEEEEEREEKEEWEEEKEWEEEAVARRWGQAESWEEEREALQALQLQVAGLQAVSDT